MNDDHDVMYGVLCNFFFDFTFYRSAVYVQ